MLEKRFLYASITGINQNAWVLKITYNFYGLYNYDETFTFGSIEEAKNKLILERCHNNIQILDAQGKTVSLKIG